MKSKNEENRTVKLIKKSNDLVEGRYRFDIWETRVFTKMLTLIRMNDEDFKEYRIFLKDVVNDFGLSHKNSYKMLKDGAKGLTKKEIRIIRDTPEGLKEFQTHIAVGVDSFVKDGNYLDISFHPKMKPFLLQLKSQFLMYDIRNVLSIQSSFSVRIYELLKQYETIGKRRFSIQELKEMLDVHDKYPLYANFKQRVILKAQEDLEKSTDIRFTFDEIKTGKQVTEIVFHIFKNAKIVELRSDNTLVNDISSIDSLEIRDENFESENEIFELVKEFKGSNLKTVKIWVKSYPLEYIKSRIGLVKNLIGSGQKITNPMGFIQSMMSQPNIFDPIQEEKDLKQAKINQAKAEQAIKQENLSKQQQIQELKEVLENQKIAWMESKFNQIKGLVENFFTEFRKLRSQQNPPFIVELAYDHYKTNIEGIESESQEELIYNYKLGGSFGALLSDWFESKFEEEFNIMKNEYESKIEALIS